MGNSMQVLHFIEMNKAARSHRMGLVYETPEPNDEDIHKISTDEDLMSDADKLNKWKQFANSW
jgi:hypothetical protein